MTENQNPTRVPSGVPTGGQFAASARTEAGVDLPTSPSGLGTGEMIDVADLSEGDRFVYTWGLGSADGDQVVTTVSVFRDGLNIAIATEEVDEAIEVDPDATVELVADEPLTGPVVEDPWTSPAAHLPASTRNLDPWTTLHPGATDDEYALPEDAGYGATRQTSAPIRPVDTDVSPRRAKAFADMIRDGEIDMNPPYQRASVWGMDQRVNLIHSFLAQTPVPAVIINRRHTPRWAMANGGPLKAGEAPYAVIDGKQRLETVRAWFAGEFGVPKSWFADEDVEDYFQTPDGPYVNYPGLALRVRRDFAQNAILPVGESTVATIEEEAQMYVRVNSAGTEQTAADMANARAWADGTANDQGRHQCGYDFDPYCDGCRAARGDGGF